MGNLCQLNILQKSSCLYVGDDWVLLQGRRCDHTMKHWHVSTKTPWKLPCSRAASVGNHAFYLKSPYPLGSAQYKENELVTLTSLFNQTIKWVIWGCRFVSCHQLTTRLQRQLDWFLQILHPHVNAEVEFLKNLNLGEFRWSKKLFTCERRIKTHRGKKQNIN